MCGPLIYCSLVAEPQRFKLGNRLGKSCHSIHNIEECVDSFWIGFQLGGYSSAATGTGCRRYITCTPPNDLASYQPCRDNRLDSMEPDVLEIPRRKSCPPHYLLHRRLGSLSYFHPFSMPSYDLSPINMTLVPSALSLSTPMAANRSATLSQQLLECQYCM